MYGVPLFLSLPLHGLVKAGIGFLASLVRTELADVFLDKKIRGIGMKKVGIIRCQQTEDLCPGTTDFVTAAKGKGSFEAFGECQIVGFVSCGGCPGKRAVARAKMLVDRGAEAVALASCIGKGSPIGFPCPNREQMVQAIRAKIGDIPLLEYTH